MRTLKNLVKVGLVSGLIPVAMLSINAECHCEEKCECKEHSKACCSEEEKKSSEAASVKDEVSEVASEAMDKAGELTGEAKEQALELAKHIEQLAKVVDNNFDKYLNEYNKKSEVRTLFNEMYTKLLEKHLGEKLDDEAKKVYEVVLQTIVGSFYQLAAEADDIPKEQKHFAQLATKMHALMNEFVAEHSNKLSEAEKEKAKKLAEESMEYVEHHVSVLKPVIDVIHKDIDKLKKLNDEELRDYSKVITINVIGVAANDADKAFHNVVVHKLRSAVNGAESLAKKVVSFANDESNMAEGTVKKVYKGAVHAVNNAVNEAKSMISNLF